MLLSLLHFGSTLATYFAFSFQTFGHQAPTLLSCCPSVDANEPPHDKTNKMTVRPAKT